MKCGFLLLLVSLTICNVTLNLGQSLPGEQDPGMLQRAQRLLIRSILTKLEDEEVLNHVGSLPKRQHPGKRFPDDVLEKRQHPGKREEEAEQEEVEEDVDLQKRQHPGKREYEVELQKRQHPGKRSLLEPLPRLPEVAHLGELEKRQHPGKRYLLYVKRQHPGRRALEEDEEEDSMDEAADEAELEKRQHPGKRFWDTPDLGSSTPCEDQDNVGCSKALLLLELLDNVNKSRAEEKRQHPGKRSIFDDLTEQEQK